MAVQLYQCTAWRIARVYRTVFVHVLTLQPFVAPDNEVKAQQVGHVTLETWCDPDREMNYWEAWKTRSNHHSNMHFLQKNLCQSKETILHGPAANVHKSDLQPLLATPPTSCPHQIWQICVSPQEGRKRKEHHRKLKSALGNQETELRRAWNMLVTVQEAACTSTVCVHLHYTMHDKYAHKFAAVCDCVCVCVYSKCRQSYIGSFAFAVLINVRLFCSRMSSFRTELQPVRTARESSARDVKLKNRLVFRQ